VQDQQEEFIASGGAMGAFFVSTDLPKNELAAEVVRSFGELRLRVTGSSMLPAIRPDDLLLIRHCRVEQAGPGDVVLYIRHRRLFAHRVISRSGARLVTQGDGIAEPDLPLTANELLGKVIRVMRRGKSIRNESTLTLPARMAAALFRYSAIAGRLFTLLHGLQRRARL
jgi:phage repressor protein C with HTH and peptisase S24 domain